MRFWLIAVLVIWTAVLPARAHEPGRGTLRIVADGSSLTINLSGPAQDFTGIAGPVATPGQAARLAKTLETLRAGDRLFLLPPEAWCRLVSVAVSPPGSGTNVAANDDAERTELTAFWQFQCDSPAALLWVETRLFGAFPALLALGSSIVAPAGQKTVVLTPGTTRALLPLRR